MTHMTDQEFADWKKGQEEKILRIREESEEIRRETDEIRRETAKFRRESDEQTAKERRETDRRMAEATAESDRRMKRIEKDFGGWTNNANKRLEDEFAEALEEAMQIGGIALDEVQRRVKYRYEYDLLGINGDAVVVGEIKRKLLPEDVRHFAENRLPHFTENFPSAAQGRKVFGMVCGETVVPDAAAAAAKLRLFVLRLKNKKLLVENADTARPVN